MIVLRDVRKAYPIAGQLKTVLSQVNAYFSPGVWYTITGPSGAGKSTLLAIAAGLELPCSGAVERTAGLRVGFMFQQPSLLPELTVFENVMVPGCAAGLSFADCKKRALSLLDRFGCSAYAHQSPISLSGGEQQRVAFVRALIHEPQVLFADEPTAFLDAENAVLVHDLLRDSRSAGVGVVLSSHDQRLIENADEVLRLDQGQITKMGGESWQRN